MRTRTAPAVLAADAELTLGETLRSLGLDARPARRGEPGDLVLTLPGGQTLAVEVKAMALPTADRVDRLLAAATAVSRSADLLAVVADQIPAAMRERLDELGVGWLDRRGHLRLVGHGLFVDTDFDARARHSRADAAVLAPIAGRSGLAAASALLLAQEDHLGVTEIAGVAGLNPSSITRSLAALADSQLAERVARGRYRALVPELFWALADVWPRERTVVRWALAPLTAGDGLAHPLADPGDSTWVAGGVRGALEWGAPIAATADQPIDLYLPSALDVRRIAARHAGGEGAEVRLAVDPNGFVAREARQVPAFPWPLAHPLFCALDLTATARDREALEQWDPPEPYPRVW